MDNYQIGYFKKIGIRPIIIGIVSCVLFGYNYFSYNILLIYLGTALLFLGMIFFEIEEATMLLFLVCPNTYYIMIGGSAICGYLAIVLLIRLLWKKPSIDAMVFLSVIAFLMYVVLQGTVFGLFIRVVPIIKSLIFVLTFSSLYKNISGDAREFTERICKGYIFGAIISCVLALFFYKIFGRRIISLSMFDRFTGLTKDPNYFSATLAFALALELTLCFRKMKFQLFDIISIVLLIVTGLLTLSRGFLLTIVVVGMISIVPLLKTRGSKKIGIILGLILGVFCLLLILRSMPSVWASLLARINDDTYSGGSGRTEYWALYINRIKSSVFGFVLGYGPEKILVDSGYVPDVSHNTFIDIFYEFGLLGSMIYFMIYYNFGLQLRKHFNNRISINYFMPLAAIVISYSLLTALTGDNFILTLLLCVVVMVIMPNEEKNGKRRTVDEIQCYCAYL